MAQPEAVANAAALRDPWRSAMPDVSRRELLRGVVPAALGLFGLPALASAIQEASSPYRRPKLKITDVRTAEVLAHGYQLHVRIYTDQGLIGQGEGDRRRPRRRAARPACSGAP